MKNQVFGFRKSFGCLGMMAMLVLAFAGTVLAQTTAFTYQGKLVDNGAPASGNYDLTFKLFDIATVGSGVQQGGTLSLTNVAVSGGVFTLQLDFGACASCFNGAARFLEISVKPSSGGTFTTLSPRQPVTANPYAIKSLSAASADGLSLSCVSCVTSSQIESVQGPQITGNIAGSQINGTIPVASVPAGSSNYIQNRTTPQAATNFYIDGDGRVGGILTGGVVNVAQYFAIGGTPVLRPGPSNGNVALGVGAGDAFLLNQGSNTTLIGANTKVASTFGYSNATAIGAYATVAQSDSLVLGSINGVNGATANARVGIGTTAPAQSLHVVGNSAFIGNLGIGTTAPAFRLHVEDPGALGLRVETNTQGGTVASFGGNGDFQIDANGQAGGRFTVKENGNIGIGTASPNDKLEVNGIIRQTQIGAGGANSLCRNSLFQISSCSSSRRYKDNIADFSSGLSLLNRLRPVTFDWKESKMHDLGLVAEEVAEIEPLLVTHNDKGEIEGVKYDRLGVVLINAIKEQQAQIEALRKENVVMKARLVVLEQLMQQQSNSQIKNDNQKN